MLLLMGGKRTLFYLAYFIYLYMLYLTKPIMYPVRIKVYRESIVVIGW